MAGARSRQGDEGEALRPKRDPEEVYEVIKTWLTDGDVKSVAEGARRYHEDILGGIGEPETVRGLYYAGKKIAG